MLFCGKEKNMNKCIISGKVLNDIQFEFLYDSKHISIAMCYINLNDNSVVKIYRI